MKTIIYNTILFMACFLSISLFAQDPNEPNNSFGEATPINLDVGMQGIIDPSTDVDYFVVNTPRAGCLIARLDPVPTGLRIRMRIYNGDQEVVVDEVSGTGQLLEMAAVLEAGTNYVVLSRFNGSSTDPYTLTLTLDPNDLNEVNDSFNQASPIALDTPTKGTIRPSGDIDYFVINTPRAGCLIARLNPVPTGLRIRMRIYNEDQELVVDEVSGTGQLLEMAAVLEAETNYVVLSRFGGSSNDPYTLQLTLDPNDLNEVNDSFNQAFLIGPNSPTSGTIRPIADVDYFKFDVIQQGEVTAILDPVPTGLRMRMQIYDHNQQPVSNGNVVSNNGQRLEVSVTLNTGINYVRLARFNGSSNDPYALTLQGSNIGTPTAIINPEGVLQKFSLQQNYPNPFNPATTIEYTLPKTEKVHLTVFNMLGQEVATLVNGEAMQAGVHSATYNAENLPSGVYYYRINAGDFSETKKMLLVR